MLLAQELPVANSWETIHRNNGVHTEFLHSSLSIPYRALSGKY